MATKRADKKLAFKDRKTGLVIFGIIHIIIGALCALGMLFTVVGAIALRAFGESAVPAMNIGQMLLAALLYLLFLLCRLFRHALSKHPDPHAGRSPNAGSAGSKRYSGRSPLRQRVMCRKRTGPDPLAQDPGRRHPGSRRLVARLAHLAGIHVGPDMAEHCAAIFHH